MDSWLYGDINMNLISNIKPIEHAKLYVNNIMNIIKCNVTGEEEIDIEMVKALADELERSNRQVNIAFSEVRMKGNVLHNSWNDELVNQSRTALREMETIALADDTDLIDALAQHLRNVAYGYENVETTNVELANQFK